MAFVLRITGRFVLVERYSVASKMPVGGPDLYAIDVSVNPDVKGRPHEPLLVAPRASVIPYGTRQPDGLLFAGVSLKSPGDDEYAYWKIRDTSLKFDDAKSIHPLVWPAVTKADDLVVPELGELTGDLGSKPSNRAVASHVTLCGGDVTLKQIEKVYHEFVELKDPASTNPSRAAMLLADVMHVAVNAQVLKIFVRTSSTSAVSAIVLEAKTNPTVVTLSNLCPEPSGSLDVEFASLYEALEIPPLARDRLVPRLVRNED